ncbi:MAG: hypothetical protein JJU36_09095 [Phycisphaeraceae bacterium]|nr:hypothetical protein [Phycisphaeraceae bacterium]
MEARPVSAMMRSIKKIWPLMFHRRLVLLAVMFVVISLLWAAQLASLTVVHADRHRERAESVLETRELVPTRRGAIYDRYGRPLAVDRVSHDLAVNFSLISGRWAYLRALREARRVHRHQWAELAPAERDHLIDRYRPEYEAQVDRLWEEISEMTGVSLTELDQRKDEIRRRVAQIRGSVLHRRLQRRMEEVDEPPTTAAGLAVPIREETEYHAIAEGLDEETRRRLESLTLLARGSDDPEHIIWRLVSVQPSTRREYPVDKVVIPIDTSTFPSTLRRSEPLRIEVDGAETLLVGLMRPVWSEDIARRPFRRPRTADTGRRPELDLGGYLVGDTIGRMGLELSLESSLRGRRGERVIQLDTMESTSRAPEPGSDVHLTLDLRLQQRIQAMMHPDAGLMRSQPWHLRRDVHDPRYGENPDRTLVQPGDPLTGGAVVLDVRTGEILAAVSVPQLSRAQLEDDPRSVWGDVLNRPFVNRAVGLNWKPGSTLKSMVLAGAMADGVHRVGQTINCTGALDPRNPEIMRCWIYRQFGQTHGHLEAPEALARSCNIFFYVLGRDLGARRVIDWYERFGLGQHQQSGVADLSGSLPRSGPRTTSNTPGFTQSDAIFMAIGQGPVEWTLLQSANAYAALGRGGIYMHPTIVRDREALGLPVVRQDMAIPPDVIEYVLRGLDESSNTSYGTTYRLSLLGGERIFNVPGVRVMAKSGTAQAVPLRWDSDGDGRITTRDQIIRQGSHAWCIALVRREGSDTPDYVVAVAVEFAGSGGAVAGPIVNQILHALRAEGYL